MSKLGPSEFWRVIARIDDKYKRERIYKGPGGKKKAYDFVKYAKKYGATDVLVEHCYPQWTKTYEWSLQEDE